MKVFSILVLNKSLHMKSVCCQQMANLLVFNKICAQNAIFCIRQMSNRHMSNLSISEAISKAEICLGYSIKDLSVKHIVCNQRLKLLIKESSLTHPNEHPVILAKRKLDPEIEVNYKSRALVTLLLAKAVSYQQLQTLPQFKFNLNLNKSGSLTKQLLLAETIELIYGGCVFHTTGISDTTGNDRKVPESIIKGNRLAVLTGDLLFSTATKNLAKLKNSRVTELMSKGLRDFIEGEYLYLKLKQQIEFGNWTNVLDNWVKITGLKSSSLLANGCQSMVHLSANCETLEERVYKFGYNIGYAWNVAEDLDQFNRLKYQMRNQTNIEYLFSLPLLIYLNSKPELRNQINTNKNINQFIEKISQDVENSDSIKKTQSLLEFYSNTALEQIKDLPDSDAKTSLSNIVIAIIQKQL